MAGMKHHLPPAITGDRPLLVGEANPYGADPEYALFPYPENSAGGRLCRLVLGYEGVGEYLRTYDRANLCTGKWGAVAARDAADDLLGAQLGRSPAPVVLLGRKVAAAFDRPEPPFSMVRRAVFGRDRTFVLLPHPSGLCRLWSEPGAFERARALLLEAGVPVGGTTGA